MMVWTKLDELVNHQRRYFKKDIEHLLTTNSFKIEKLYFVDFIGWAVLLVSKLLRINLDFNIKKIKFYDKYIFKPFRFLYLQKISLEKIFLL